MSSRSTFFDRIIISSWRRMLHLWKPMAGWTIIVWLILSLIMVPLFSAVLGWGIFRGDQLVVGNEDIMGWLLTPGGIIYLTLAGALTLFAGVIRFAGLFRIVTDDMEGRSVSLKSTVLRIIPYVPKLFKLSIFIVICAGIILLPLALGFGVIYLIILGAHDINYYLTAQPSEWYFSLFLGGIWTFLWLLCAIYLFGRVLLGLPAYLSTSISIRDAIFSAWNLSRDRTVRFLRLLLFSAGIWITAILVMDAILLFIASNIIDWVAIKSNSLRIIALFTGGYFAIALAVSALMGFLGFSFVSTVVTKFYYEDSKLFMESPPPPEFHELQARFAEKVNRLLTPVRLVPVLLLFITGSTAASVYIISQINVPGEMLIIAHRAGPPPAPENTLSALESAIEAEADYAEIDVQRTADGVVVVVHDADLMRVAGDPRRIDQNNYDEIKNLVQRPDDGSPPDERRIASLDEFLDRAGGRISLMIELKYYGFDPQLVDAVVERVRAYQMENQVVLMSLRLESVNQMREKAPEITAGYVSAITIGNLSRLLVDFLAVNHQAVTPGLVRNAHQSGIEIYPWNVNRINDLAKMADLGVDGLITDEPALARRVINELNAMNNLERLLLRFGSLLIETDEYDQVSNF